ncbi:MAG: ABC transporter ATP-binding protein [Bacillati bacterium ANGP1]|uniref:ABC transporter ATP-binding protein n=1 Tax=Candidatus Segetimicrobium genomatis TaxID=2569760 RepID=A0A537J0B1_9BACT|nr:MAG: ABC transporter ATP-binding protein [Terrabacteria group bacterium ANGP1]
MRGVSVYYETVRAIVDVSIAAEAGEIIALIGANGAGKTTTLRALTGLARIVSGEIWFHGRRIDGLAVDRIVGLGIAMVPEGRRIFPFMSVRDNLLMGAFRRRDRRRIVEDLERIFVRFPRLKERLRQQAGTLSDEPSLGLAPQLVREIARAIRAINRDEGVTVILVEQNSRMALQLSSRAYVLETGRVALDGRSSDLINNDDVRRLYLGG